MTALESYGGIGLVWRHWARMTALGSYGRIGLVWRHWTSMASETQRTAWNNIFLPANHLIVILAVVMHLRGLLSDSIYVKISFKNSYNVSFWYATCNLPPQRMCGNNLRLFCHGNKISNWIDSALKTRTAMRVWTVFSSLVTNTHSSNCILLQRPIYLFKYINNLEMLSKCMSIITKATAAAV